MDRLDRVERTLEEMSVRHAESLREHSESLREHSESLRETDRLHREAMQRVDARLEYMAARQHYHDEAFERFDSRMKRIEDAIAIDAENIRALARIAEAHQRRLDEIQGDSPA